MDIQNLKRLFAVLHTGSFTEAGEQNHLSQSAISKNIISLEKELGVKLVEKEGKRVYPTESGKRLGPHFIQILEAYDHAMQVVDEIHRAEAKKKNKLRIAVVRPISHYNIVSAITKFQKQHPELNVSIDETEPDRIYLSLQSDDCDLAFCSDIKLDRKYYDTQQICGERFMLAVHPHSPLAKRKTVSVRDLKGKKLLLNRPMTEFFYPCIDVCRNAGFEPNVAATLIRPVIALEIIQANSEFIYMGLQQALLDEKKSDQYCLLPIEDSPEFNFVFAWKKNSKPNEPTALFLDYMAKYLPLHLQTNAARNTE